MNEKIEIYKNESINVMKNLDTNQIAQFVNIIF